jgi:hypothetical protein
MTYAWLFTNEASVADIPITLTESPWLEAFARIIDALARSRGTFLHRVQMDGLVSNADNRLLAHKRTVVWSGDVADVLRACARHWARDITWLWDAPPVVREYLETGQEELRAAAEKITGAAHSKAALRLYGPDKDKAPDAEIAAEHAINAAWAAIAQASVADYAARVAADQAAFAKACVLSRGGCGSRDWRETRKFIIAQQDEYITQSLFPDM